MLIVFPKLSQNQRGYSSSKLHTFPLPSVVQAVPCSSLSNIWYSIVSPLQMSTGRIVKLNIGGYKFCTTSSTLTKYPNTFFTALLSENLPTTKDDEGAYFIDRDGQYFAPILTYLRTNEVSIPSTMTKDDVLREAKFYSIEPLIEELTVEPVPQERGHGMHCPPDLEKYVHDYWERHQCTIMKILSKLNYGGFLTVSVQIVPGHRQDFERPPQLLENGKLGLYMNFTSLHISKYARVQCLLAKLFKERGISGYFRPGEFLELWWLPEDNTLKRDNDIVYF